MQYTIPGLLIISPPHIIGNPVTSFCWLFVYPLHFISCQLIIPYWLIFLHYTILVDQFSFPADQSVTHWTLLVEQLSVSAALGSLNLPDLAIDHQNYGRIMETLSFIQWSQICPKEKWPHVEWFPEIHPVALHDTSMATRDFKTRSLKTGNMHDKTKKKIMVTIYLAYI